METTELGTLPTVRELEKAGFQPEQADMLASAFDQIAGFNREIGRDLRDLKKYVETQTATKGDIAELKVEMVELRAGTVELRAEMKADIARLRADMFRALWLQGGALATLILTLAGFLLTRS